LATINTSLVIFRPIFPTG